VCICVLRRGICGSIRRRVHWWANEVRTERRRRRRYKRTRCVGGAPKSGVGGGGGGGGAAVTAASVRPNAERRKGGNARARAHTCTRTRAHSHTRARTPYQMTSAVAAVYGWERSARSVCAAATAAVADDRGVLCARNIGERRRRRHARRLSLVPRPTTPTPVGRLNSRRSCFVRFGFFFSFCCCRISGGSRYLRALRIPRDDDDRFSLHDYNNITIISFRRHPGRVKQKEQN